MRDQRRYGATLALFTVLCLGIGLAASSDEPAAKKNKSRPTAESTCEGEPLEPLSETPVADVRSGEAVPTLLLPGTEGMRVYRDPATGRFVRPPAAARGMSEAVQRMLSRSTEGLTSRVLPNGATALDLQGRFMNLSVARRNPDGTISTGCVHLVDQAGRHLHPEVSQSDPKTEEVRDDR